MLMFQCLVCLRGFRTRAKWHEHLPKRTHQDLARKELSIWDANVRTRALIFAKLPVDKNVEIINQLSAQGGGIVTDFVLCPGSGQRPAIGMFLFETREQLLKILTPLKSKKNKFYIDDSWCEVRDGEVVTELEWKKYLKEDNMTSGIEGSGTEDDISDIHGQSNEPPSAKRIKLEPRMEQVKEQATIENGMSSIILAEDLELRHHLTFVQKLMEIPEEEYNTALNITRKLEQSLNETYSKVKVVGRRLIPRTELCRNWALRLKYSPNEDQDNVGCVALISCEPPDWISRRKGLELCVAEFFCDAEEALYYEVMEMEPDKSLGICNSNNKSLQSNDKGPRFIKRRHFKPLPNCVLPPLTMSFLYKPSFLAEKQVWRLLKYLCCFDTRSSPVLLLAYYWAKTNSITVGKTYTEGTPYELADPSGLNWLVMFFFQSEKLIPNTRSVLEQPHEPLSLAFVKNWEVDFGFSDSEEYAASWRRSKNPHYDSSDAGQEKFADDVFTLFYKFLLFCGNQLGRSKGNRGWILDTMNLERIPVADVLTGDATNYKLTSHQLYGILNTPDPDKVIMLSPFFRHGRISTSNAELAFEAMRKTGMKLESYLASGTNLKREKLELEEFLELMKV